MSQLMLNFDQIGPGFFLPMCMKYHSSGSDISSFWFFSDTAEAPTLIFTQNMTKDAVQRKDVPFGVFKTNKNLMNR